MVQSVAVQTSYVNTGSKSLKFSGATSNVVALPLFKAGETTVEINTLQITIFTRPEGTYSSSKDFDIGYITDLEDASTFKAIATYNYADFPSGYLEKGPVSMASAPDGAYIAFRHRPSSSSYYWFVDDITVEEIPACPYPSDLQVSGVTHEDATVTWTSDESAWQIVWSTNENFDPAAATPTSVTTKSYTITGLTALTDYYVYVRSNCTASGNGYSDWSDKLHFKTTAQATAVGDSWSDDFEGASCGWELINGSQTNQWVWSTTAYNSGTHALYITNSPTTTPPPYTYTVTGAQRVYATKLLHFENGKYAFTFDWECYGESSSYDYLSVGLLPATATITADNTNSGTLPTGWIALHDQQYLLGQTTWQTAPEKAIQMTAGNYYLVLRWRQDGSGPSSGTIQPAAVDNVSITRIACPYDVENLAVATTPAVTESTATVTWTAGEATQWQVAYSTNSNFEGATQEIVSSASYNMTGLTADTKYYVKVRAYCGGSDYGLWSNAISFYTECPEYTTIPTEGLTINFDDMTGVTSGTTNNLPHCWDYINTSTNSTYKGYPVIYNNQSSSHSGNNHLRFYSYLYYNGSSITTSDPKPQYAILPQMQDVNGLRLKLYARAGNTGTNYNASFKVGIMSDPADANTFELIDTKTPASTTYEQFIIPFNNYTGTGTYIAIMIDAAEGAASAYANYYHYVCIDNITVEEIPSCVEPSDLAEVANTATTNSVRFGWTAVNNETTWKVQYKKSDATDWTTVSDPITTNPYTLNGLDHSSTYQVRVAAWCTPSDPDGISEYSEPITVQTECEAITSFPWNETFESYAAGNFSDQCWVNEHISGDGTYIFRVYTSSIGTNNTHMLQLPDQSLGTLTKLRLPEMTLPDNNYQFVIDVYRSNSYSNKTDEGIRVFVSTDGEITGATELAFIPRYYNFASGIIPAEPIGDQWYTYELPIGISGTCYIILRGENQYGTSTYMDNLAVEEISACNRPSALACTTKTAHTATLGWTDGAASPASWQIAYSTTADFDPATVTPVNVTTNPATISGLTVGTTYYAYVRANCDTDGYSPWSRKSCTFTTIANGANPPTGLAVNPATITSTQATSSWTGVATNDYHASYDLYYALATVTAVPDEPVVPNLIAGITATSQVISGLEAETEYKVWVRDNCGTDGYSNWSSAVTFTTASACQTPDDLAESDVTTTSAKITWNTYGQTDFNLRYSNDEGATWTTVPNVSSPYTFSNNLTANTAYQVQVQAVCNTEAWSTVLNFRTDCYAITITDSNSYTEDFEDPVVTSTYDNISGLEVPYCWDNYTSNTTEAYTIPHLIKSDAGSSGYNYSSPASQVLYFYGSGNGYAALPEFTNALNTLQVNFKFAVESPFYGTLTLGYITGEDNGTYNTFQEIKTYTTTTSATMVQAETTYLNDVPATATRLVFRWYHNSWYGANIDDIEVSLLPSCYPVGTLSYSDVLSSSAKLSWTLVDNTQDEWTVQYATNDAFTEGVGTKTATTNTHYELPGLTPETHYWVRVKAACSTTDDWSNIVNFTTLEACPTPTDIAATNLTQVTADLSWTGYSDSYNIQYRTATAIGTPIFTEDFSAGIGEWTMVDCHSSTGISKPFRVAADQFCRRGGSA